jgi:hypothetical protein
MLLNRSKLKTNLTTGISVMSYSTPERFPPDIMGNDRNQWSQENPYNSRKEQDREVGLA